MPRVNVTVTEEQHTLLLELARLRGGSAAGYLRQQLDLSTPLLRAAVPLLQRAAEESRVYVDEARELLDQPLKLLRELGVHEQDELFPDKGRVRSSRSERAASEDRAHPSSSSSDK
jgi:hypothetical protein